MSKGMKKTWIIVLVIAIAIVLWLQNGGSGQYLGVNDSASPAPEATAAPAAKASKPKAAAPTPDTRTYSQMVQQYGSNRIQFDDRCQASPTSVTFKQGASIMLDNRSTQGKTITVAGKQYSVPGYGWQVVTLSSASLPSNLIIGCNAATNVGTIRLQANISGQ